MNHGVALAPVCSLELAAVVYSFRCLTMPMSPEQIEERLALTRDAAIALIEDLQYLREVLERENPSPGELRRLSAVLRRLLIGTDRDLLKVAAPRIGRIKLLEPDNAPVYRASRKGALEFYASGRVRAFGIEHGALMTNKGSRPLPLDGFDPSRTIEVRVDNFLSQHVLFLNGEWASRGDAIKFIAYVGGGIHSGSPETAIRGKQEVFALLGKIRRCVSIRGAEGVTTTISMNMSAIESGDQPIKYDPLAIDAVLVEVLATARFITDSPDVERLEAVILKEISAAS